MSDTVARPGRERDVGVGVPGRLAAASHLGEPFRQELVWVREDPGVAVQQEVEKDHVGVGGNGVAVDFDGLRCAAGY